MGWFWPRLRPDADSDPLGDLGGYAQRRLAGWRAVLAALLLMAVLAAAFVALARQVQDDLDRLGTARTDNAYWTLTQLEVEFLELGSAVVRAMAAPALGPAPGPRAEVVSGPDPDLAALRRRYDILFSRVATLQESPIYRAALVQAGSVAKADGLARDLRALVPLFDGPDADLRAALPLIDRRLTALRPDLRDMAVDGNLLLAKASAAGRSRVAATLLRLAWVTLGLLAVLGALAVGFYRVSHIARSRARQMRRASLRLAAIVDTAPDGLIVTDGAGRIEQVNPAAAAALGWSQAALAGRDIGALLRRCDSGDPLVLPAAGAGPHRIAVTALRADGSGFPADLAVMRAAVGPVPDGAAVAVLFLRDVSDRVAAEDRLRLARDQALAGERAKAHFIAVMSHEMRTPLNVILGLTDLMATAPLPDPQRAQVALLNRSGRILLQHVNDVLDIARLEARGAELVARPFDLIALAQDLVTGLTPEATARGNRLLLDIHPTAQGGFSGDAARLRQVLANLLTNAVKYTRDGSVTLSIAAQDGPVPVVTLEIADTGIGIAPDQIDAVFGDFVRLETPGLAEEGSGLGLGIVQRLVQAMRGEMGVDSEPGAGSVFWVRLPLQRAALAGRAGAGPVDLPHPAQPPATQDAELPQDGGFAPVPPQQVLIAEDHPVNQMVLRQMLERDGHHVVAVADGAAAVAMAAAQRFDIILMDIAMPGLDGLAATRLIRAGAGLSLRARIVAVTAHAFAEDRARFLAAGFDAVIVKPVISATLRQVFAAAPAPVLGPASGGADADVAAHPGPAGPPAGIDAAHLRRLVALGGPGTARAALSGLQAEAAALAGDLHAGTGTGTGTGMGAGAADRLHRLAGLAGTCGAQRLAGLAVAGEQAIRHGQDWDAAPLLAEIALLGDLDMAQVIADLGPDPLPPDPAPPDPAPPAAP